MSTFAAQESATDKSQLLSNSPNTGLLLQRKCAFGLPKSLLTCEYEGKTRLQAKLTIGASNDPLEQEADRVADQVLAAPAHSAVSGAVPSIQRFTGQSGQSTGDAGTAPASVDRVLSGSGRPLDPVIQQDMGQRFGHDFSQVRVHTDSAAEQSAQDINAHAYTVGYNIVFNAGRFAPGSHEGQRLIAHELAHVVQGEHDPGKAVHRVAWTPTRADELTSTGADRFASQTFELSIPSLTGEAGTTRIQNIEVSVFVPAGATVPRRNKVHVFFSPGNAVQTGLRPAEVGMNAAMTHGFRGVSDRTEWILISVPGRSGSRSEANGFNTIDTAGVQACLRAAGRATTTIDALRFSSHSRGSRGLRETLNRHLISGPVVDRVVVFDAAFSSLDRALAHSRIPGSNMIALNVVDSGRLTVRGARNIQLNPSAMRAIGYSRIIRDAMTMMPSLVVPAAVRTQLLTLPARGLFTTASPPPAGMENINDFARANVVAIRSIVAHENDPGSGLKNFIDANNLIRLGTVFSSSIYSHHLFVAELAHEVTN